MKRMGREKVVLLLAGTILLVPLIFGWVLVLQRSDAQRSAILEKVLLPTVVTSPDLSVQKDIPETESEPSANAIQGLVSEKEFALLLREAEGLMKRSDHFYSKDADKVAEHHESQLQETETWYVKIAPLLEEHYEALMEDPICPKYWFYGTRIVAARTWAHLYFQEHAATLEGLLNVLRLEMIARNCQGFGPSYTCDLLANALATDTLGESDLDAMLEILGQPVLATATEDMQASAKSAAEDWNHYLTGSPWKAMREYSFGFGARMLIDQSPFARPFVNSYVERSVEAAEQVAALAGRPFWEVELEVAQTKDVYSFWHVLALITAEAAEFELARLAVLLKQFEIRHRRYPATLAEAVGSHMGVSTVDPFTGMPYMPTKLQRGAPWSGRGGQPSSRPMSGGHPLRGGWEVYMKVNRRLVLSLDSRSPRLSWA